MPSPFSNRSWFVFAECALQIVANSGTPECSPLKDMELYQYTTVWALMYMRKKLRGPGWSWFQATPARIGVNGFDEYFPSASDGAKHLPIKQAEELLIACIKRFGLPNAPGLHERQHGYALDLRTLPDAG